MDPKAADAVTLALTPAMLETAYEFLRTFPPFRGWRLPPADEIEFHVTETITFAGSCQVEDVKRITISNRHHGQMTSLLATMAHEMIHLWQLLRGTHAKDTDHNEAFDRAAKRICRTHGFDPKLF